MNNEVISIIIPVYNVEKYLEKSLKSVLCQSYENLDVILVDDGSTDESGAICDQYKRLDKRVTVLHKTNGGLSDARNKGLKLARGRYVIFVDSDDYVSEDYVQHLYQLTQNNSIDIGITSVVKIKEGVAYTIPSNEFRGEETVIYDRQEALANMLYREGIPIYAYAKIYKRSLFEKNNFAVGELFEDLSIQYKLFHEAKKIAFNPVQDYYYLQRENSIINSKYSSRKMIQVYTCERIICFVHKHYSDITKAAISKCFITSLNHYFTIPKGKMYREDRNYTKKIIKKCRETVLHDERNKIVVRMLAGFSFISIELLYGIAYFYNYLIEKNIIKIRKPI